MHVLSLPSLLLLKGTRERVTRAMVWPLGLGPSAHVASTGSLNRSLPDPGQDRDKTLEGHTLVITVVHLPPAACPLRGGGWRGQKRQKSEDLGPIRCHLCSHVTQLGAGSRPGIGNLSPEKRSGQYLYFRPSGPQAARSLLHTPF